MSSGDNEDFEFVSYLPSRSASVVFMLAGAADFRRRYFTARLLNTMLKDGWYGDEELHPKKREKLRQLHLLQQKSVYHLGLTVNFTDPRSVAGWWSARVLVNDFGRVFYMRVKVRSLNCLSRKLARQQLCLCDLVEHFWI